MKYNPDIHHRRSIRLKGYDYSQNGIYFITICTYNRDHLFGKVIGDQMILNEFGIIVHGEWIKSAEIRKEIELNEFVIMPNHFHGIVTIRRGDRRSPFLGYMPKLQNKSIGSLIASFKSAVTKKINRIRENPDMPIWQRNYHEHIIRNEESFEKIKDYVIHNPKNWKDDQFFSS